MAIIKNNNYKKIDCRLYNDSYMDFILSKDDVRVYGDINECIAAHLDFSGVDKRHVVSDAVWGNAIASDGILHNIGYTGVDNGFISYERDMIGNDEFLELFVNSKFSLNTFGDRFFVTKVDGNAMMQEYPVVPQKDYVSLKGGFYQGFFKIYGDKYQTLPYRIMDEWNISMTLRKRDYETPSNILNKRHVKNKGFFFFIGARSENKFWELYKSMPTTEELKYTDLDDYSEDYDIMSSNVTRHQYHEDIPNPENRDDGYGDLCECTAYFQDGYDPYAEGEGCFKKGCDNDYFTDDYTGKGTTVGCDCPVNDLAIEDDYMQEQLQLDSIKLEDSKGNAIGEKGFYEIETDNKFIIFNAAKDGFNTKTWDDAYKFILTGKKDCPNINYFPYLNQTSSGYTKNNIDKLIKEHTYAYNVFKDIECNALGFKINDDGSISYRYISKKCEVIEETSKPNIIKEDEWYDIHIKILRKKGSIPVCDEHYRQGMMQIYVYVNGYLKMVSRELPELILRTLDDNPERQEGIPYSISIGGGSQGLSERILLDYYDRTDYVLPIEENFAGSFIGDIKDFTFIPCPIDFAIISQKRQGF